MSDPDYTNSRPINLSIWSTDSNFNKITDYVYDRIKIYLGKSLKRNEKLYKKNLKVALLNLYKIYSINSKRYIAYSRYKDNPLYKKSRYNKNGVSAVLIKMFDALDSSGLIDDHKKGFFNRELGKGFNTRIRANNKLITILKKKYISEDHIFYNDDEIILRAPKIGKQKRGENIPYKETPDIKNMRKVVKKINRLINKSEITLDVSPVKKALLKRKKENPVNFSRKFLHRIFIDSDFEKGGRLFGHWCQNIPKELRKKILINGEKTSEYDYSGVHIRILYAREGINLSEVDPYRILGYKRKDRKLLKKILQATLNASNKKKALKSVEKKVSRKFNNQYSYEQIKDFYNWLIKKHNAIKKYFNTGIGKSLQYDESRIAEKILIELSDKNIVCLPIHDSFIVTKSNEQELIKAMIKAYKKVVGFNPRIDKK